MRTKEENIQFIIDQSETKKATEENVENVLEVMRQRAQVDDIESDPAFKSMMKEIKEALVGQEAWDYLSELYASNFTDEELAEVAKLYENENFLNFVRKAPEISAQSQAKMTEKINKIVFSHMNGGQNNN